jgi:hypothetical protein
VWLDTPDIRSGALINDDGEFRVQIPREAWNTAKLSFVFFCLFVVLMCNVLTWISTPLGPDRKDILESARDWVYIQTLFPWVSVNVQNNQASAVLRLDTSNLCYVDILVSGEMRVRIPPEAYGRHCEFFLPSSFSPVFRSTWRLWYRPRIVCFFMTTRSEYSECETCLTFGIPYNLAAWCKIARLSSADQCTQVCSHVIARQNKPMKIASPI